MLFQWKYIKQRHCRNVIDAEWTKNTDSNSA